MSNFDHRVSPLKKGDLQYRYPTGPTASDDPSKRHEPDSSLLNRHEWYEMLYYVNKFANTQGNSSAVIAKKAERLIQQYLPSNVRSHENVTKWLLDNWMAYGDASL
jgi:hypothetical protein